MAKQQEPQLARLYPSSPKDALTSLYLGKSLSDLPTPSAILDVAAVRRNCGRMLAACRDLGLQWRAHVKTHKVNLCLAFYYGFLLFGLGILFRRDGKREKKKTGSDE